MTRIIAGEARGRRLLVPPAGTRPTSDRVREAMFAAIAHQLRGLAGAHVLDLYAGSGALGLEAASRGATRVVLVESDRRAAVVVARNVRAVGVAGAQVVTGTVESYLAGTPTPFDLVLADPPYAMASLQLEPVLARLCQGWLNSDALVVVERASREGSFSWPAGLVGIRAKEYSGTTIWYGQPHWEEH